MGYGGLFGTAKARGIGVYRTDPLSTGSSGSYVVIPWDTEFSSPVKRAFVHSTSSSAENITCSKTGMYLLSGLLRAPSGTWREMRLLLEVNGSAISTPNDGASSGLLGLVAEPGSIGFAIPFQLARNDVVRLRVASTNQSSVALVVGSTNLWMRIQQL